MSQGETGSLLDKDFFQEDTSFNPFLSQPLSRKRQRTVSDRFISVIPKEAQIQYRMDCKYSTPQRNTVFSLLTPPATLTPTSTKDWNSTPTRQRTHSLPSLQKRHISKSPELVLDAPSVRNDFYCTLLDWSTQDVCAVGLDHQVFLWNQFSLLHTIHETEHPDYINTISFNTDGELLSIGTENNTMSIYDVKRQMKVTEHRPVNGVSAMAWISPTDLITGTPTGCIQVWDIRQKEHHTLETLHHDRVVGLTTSPTEGYFASGGNGHLVFVWDRRRLDRPVWEFKSHKSAVRAMEWCPWKHNVLATGGGLDDGTIQFHNTHTGNVFLSGKLLKSIDSGCDQVCQLRWSLHYKELLTAQRSEKEQLIIWSFPTLDVIDRLPGHAYRPMDISRSPDGHTIASLGDDETLKV